PEATLSPLSLVRSQVAVSRFGVIDFTWCPLVVKSLMVLPSGKCANVTFLVPCLSLLQGFGYTFRALKSVSIVAKSAIFPVTVFEVLALLFLSWAYTVTS